MAKRSAKEEFSDTHCTANQSQVVWNDDCKQEFPLSISNKELSEHHSPFEYLVAKILGVFPGRRREEIKGIWVADELWVVEQGSLVDKVVLPY